MLISYNPRSRVWVAHTRNEAGGFDLTVSGSVGVAELWTLDDAEVEKDLFEMAGAGWQTRYWPDRKPRKCPTIAPECPQNDDQPTRQG